MDPDNPHHGRPGLPVHEEQAPAALDQSNQAEAQVPQSAFSQVHQPTTAQAAQFYYGQAAPWQEELQVHYHQPNAAQTAPFYHSQAAPFYHAQAAPIHYDGHTAPSQEQPQVPYPPVAQVAQPTAPQAAPLYYGQAAPGQEQPQVSFPEVAQVAQPAFAPAALLYDEAVPGEPAPAQPQVPQLDAFAQAAVVQPGQVQRSRAPSRAPQIQRQKENRQANAAELANDPESRNKLPWEDYEDEDLCRLYLAEASVDEMSKLMHRSTTSITQRKKNLKKSGKWDRLETEIVQADVTSPNRQRVVVSQLANLRARLAQGNGN